MGDRYPNACSVFSICLSISPLFQPMATSGRANPPSGMSPSATRRSASEALPSKPTRLLAPFHVPADSEIFALRAQQRRDWARERQSLQETRYYLRGTTSDRESFRPLTQVPSPRISAEEEALAQLILSPDSSEPSEGLHDFIDQKRDIFLAQLAIDTKREELQRLERLKREEQDRLDAQEAEITLFRDQFRATHISGASDRIYTLTTWVYINIICLLLFLSKTLMYLCYHGRYNRAPLGPSDRTITSLLVRIAVSIPDLMASCGPSRMRSTL
jgi:hypothetical protein